MEILKISQNLEIQLMREKYIDKNAIGIVGWAECDSKSSDDCWIKDGNNRVMGAILDEL